MNSKKFFMGIFALVCVFCFASCDKNDQQVFTEESAILNESVALNDPTVSNEFSILDADNNGSDTRTRGLWESKLFDDEFLAVGGTRKDGLSVKAGKTKYAKFYISRAGNYRVCVRHATVGVSLDFKRYRGKILLAEHSVKGSSYDGDYVETNIYGPQGKDSDGDVMVIKIVNNSKTDVNDLVFRYDPDFYPN